VPAVALLSCTVRDEPASRQPAALVRQAWTEYGFESFDAARTRFVEAQAITDDPALAREAQMGMAMSDQFDPRHPDPSAARQAYEQIVDKGAPREVTQMAQSLLAQVCAAEGDLPRANRLWESAVLADPGSIVAQDALLQRTYANLRGWTEPETAAAMEYLSRMRQTFPTPTPDRPGLAPVFDATLGNYYFWKGDYEAARQAFIRFTEIATTRNTSYAWMAGMYFRIARISEVLLNDRPTAGAYYRKVALETPNSVLSFFALSKAAELGSLTRSEVTALNLPGLTPETLHELFQEGGAP
jgi:tetratricopeptide (TPR) repeat protein